MAEMAKVIGEYADATRYAALLAKLKPEWHHAFWNPFTHEYSTGTQMAQVRSLHGSLRALLVGGAAFKWPFQQLLPR